MFRRIYKVQIEIKSRVRVKQENQISELQPVIPTSSHRQLIPTFHHHHSLLRKIAYPIKFSPILKVP
jgi:hypothetical protein